MNEIVEILICAGFVVVVCGVMGAGAILLFERDRIRHRTSQSHDYHGDRPSVICMDCRTILKEGGPSISHGICDDCLAGRMKDFESMKDAR